MALSHPEDGFPLDERGAQSLLLSDAANIQEFLELADAPPQGSPENVQIQDVDRLDGRQRSDSLRYNPIATYGAAQSHDLRRSIFKEVFPQINIAITPQRQLLHLAKSGEFDKAQNLISKLSNDLVNLETDEYQRTAAHYAAGHSRGEAALELMVDRLGSGCLLSGDNMGVTPLHLSTAYHPAEQFRKNLHRLSGERIDSGTGSSADILKQYRDMEGNTLVHCAAINKAHGREILLLAIKLKPKCLGWENYQKKTVLMRAVQALNKDSVTELMENVGPKLIEGRDLEGNSIAHYAALNKYDKTVVLCVTDFIRGRIGKGCLGWLNKSKQSVMHFAIKNYSSANELLNRLQVGEEAVILTPDVDKNTLLHSLFHTDTEILRRSLKHFRQAALSLASKGVNPRAENTLGQNFLHGSTLSSDALKLILDPSLPAETGMDSLNDAYQSTDDLDTVDKFQELLRSAMISSKGLHAVHAFAGRHNLETLVEPLANLSGLELSVLLHLTVQHGPHKGATCLHFACEAGLKLNVQYLINHGLKLSDESDTGFSCIDYAHKQGRFDHVLKAVLSMAPDKKMELWRLLDPTKRALKMRDLTAARTLLGSISDASIRNELNRDRYAEGDHLAIELAENVKKNNKRADMKILLRAFELDSSEVLRCGIRLNLIAPSTEALFPAYFKRILEIKKPEMYGMEEFLLSKPIDSGSELSIIDTMAFFDKVELLPNLILTRQFELIPACISLLLRLKPKIYQKQGKHEQLQELYTNVKTIAAAALDELYFNGDERERKLLFKYLQGEFKEESNGCCLGPKFPCRPSACGTDIAKVEYCTVIEMIEEVGDVDLFAINCLHNMVESEWKAKSTCDKKLSPRVKFYGYGASFVIFLIFFAVYITDFDRPFVSWPLDAILSAYAACFTMQEISDFYSRRKKRDMYIQSGIRKLPVYFRDGLNIFDVAAVMFMLGGLLWKLTFWAHLSGPSGQAWDDRSGSIYACQMMLSTSFLLWGFRSVSFLSYSDKIGMAITMLKSLLVTELVPFLAIILVIFYSFGVFFFNLLFPVIIAMSAERDPYKYGFNVILHIFTLPFNLLFNNLDKIAFERTLNGTSLSSEITAHPVGFAWFHNLLLFLFLILVNIVMVNLLIARFNLTVGRIDNKAIGIWRKTYHEMLREYQSISPVPPPFSFIFYLKELVELCRDRIVNRGESVLGCQNKDWWFSESRYPEDFHEFLKFQATNFRFIRPQLSRDAKVNKSDSESQVGQSEKLSAEAKAGFQKSVAELEDKLEKRFNQQAKLLESLQKTTVQSEKDQKVQALQDSVQKFDNQIRLMGSKLDQILTRLPK